MARASKAGIKESDNGVDQCVPPPLAFRSGASQPESNSRQDGGDSGSDVTAGGAVEAGGLPHFERELRRDHANNSEGILQGRWPTCPWRQSSNDH